MTPTVAKGLDYSPISRVYDEMTDREGQVRPAWSALLSSLSSFSPQELQARWGQVQALLRENGVTFNVYGRDDGLDRPWNLDPFPLVISTQEWSRVEEGLKQRVRLLELLLADVYGEQLCLKQGWLPGPLVWGNPQFQRPCHGLPIPAECRLLIHSVDLVRDAQGELVALRDRAETPGGSGYALENRLALTRMMPEFLQSRAIRKLGPFFSAIRSTLSELAGRFGPRANIVFLTPGSASQTYFEQAYLAQYLGYTLVEGNDLTVRDNRVYLKLLEGLRPVDVIVRRLRDGYCDPLELRSDSVIGIPGLVQAVRAGNVVVANSLGSAFAETGALQAYLPLLCEKYLGEKLLLRSVPTYWCGDSEQLDQVLGKLERYVIKCAYSPKMGSPTFFPGTASSNTRQLKEQILRNPEAFIAQERVQLSTAPSLAKGGLEPRRVLLRTFVARHGSEHCVMPGALALVSSDANSVIASLDSGSQSKDTWILEEVAAPQSRRRVEASGSVDISRGGGDISSRAADNLFWLGRYLERAEGLCRVLRACFSKLCQEPTTPASSPLPKLLYYVSPRWQPPTPGPESYGKRLLELLSKPDLPDGLRISLDGVRRLTGVLRDRLSSESWTISNQLLEWSKEHPETLPHGLDIIERMLTGFSACNGMIAENMNRNHGWLFLDIGRRLERAIYTTSLVRRCLTGRDDNEAELMEAILEITDTVRTYRRRYPAGLEAAPLLDLLLADGTNPRSVAYQLELLEAHLKQLPMRVGARPLSETERILVKCSSAIKLADPFTLVQSTNGQRRGHLTQLLREVGKTLPDFSDHLSRTYFSHLTLHSKGPTFGREVLP